MFYFARTYFLHIAMHPTFSNYTKGQRLPGYQQQSGQTIYNIGAFGPYPITMSHAPANIFVNQPQFQRTFASVVSCENPNFGANHQHFEETPDNSGIFNSFFKRLSKQSQQPVTPQPQLYQQYTHKEFEDFTKMPTVINTPQPTNYTNSYSTPLHFSGNYDAMKVPYMNHSAYYQSPPHPPPPKQHHHTPRPPRNNFLNTLWGNFYSPQQQQQQQSQPSYQKPNNNNQRWYHKGFQRFRCNRNNNHKPQQQQNRHHSRFHHSDASNPKHMHEKERNSIERDIKNDYCDIKSETKSLEDQQRCNNNNTETAKTSRNDCDNSEENPPFEIFSLEEFPAIPPSCSGSSTNKSKDDHDFVTYKDDAAATTPTYTPSWPKRISLCEKVSKIVKSPQKLLPLTLATPPRSCLKPTQRNRSMSECSDDFIVFEYSYNDGEIDDEETDSDEDDCSDDDNESEMSDDTIMGEESEDMDEVDEAMRKEDERMQCDHQPDSGIDGEYEPKKVSS